MDDVELPPWAHGDARVFVSKMRAALESPAGGALFAWNGGGPQSFQTPPSKDSSFRDDDEEASVPHRHRPGAPLHKRRTALPVPLYASELSA